MKKYIFILAVICLSMTTIISLSYAINYRTQIKSLNLEVTKLIKENKQLHENIDFIKKQYTNLKSKKNESEIINIEVQECMKDCNYTTVCMNSCVYDTIPKWEKEINKNIKLLEKIMNKEQIALLHDSQNKWTAYKDIQQKLNSETIGTMMGTMYTNILAAEQIYLIESRAKELDELYYFYSKK